MTLIPSMRSVAIHVTLLTGLSCVPFAAAEISAQTLQRDIPITEVVRTADAADLSLIQSTRAYIQLIMRTRSVPGMNIALARRGAIVWEAGFGYSDVITRTKMTPETVFHSGSMGKTYTATAIMQLVEQGVLSLHDPINKYLPFKVVNPLGGREVTIHDLMTHHSGLGSDAARSLLVAPRPLREEVEAQYREAGVILAGTLSPRWIAKPGVVWSYSNLGIATLGLIVELANSEHLSYSNYVEKHIMRPLGMRSASYPPVQDRAHIEPGIWSRMSTGYATMGRVWIPTATVYFGSFAAGGFVATPADHLRLLLTMANAGRYNDYQLLKPESVREMLTPQYPELVVPQPHGLQQALVWDVGNADKRTARFEHAGAHMFGWNNNGVAWPGMQTACVIAANEWSLPASMEEVKAVHEFIDNWVQEEARAPLAAQQPTDWTWKVSYLRGLLFAEAFTAGIGTTTRLADNEIVRIARASVVDPAGGASWDADAFIEGARAMSQVEPTAAAIHAFARSGHMKITIEEAQRAFVELGVPGVAYVSLAGLLKRP